MAHQVKLEDQELLEQWVQQVGQDHEGQVDLLELQDPLGELVAQDNKDPGVNLEHKDHQEIVEELVDQAILDQEDLQDLQVNPEDQVLQVEQVDQDHLEDEDLLDQLELLAPVELVVLVDPQVNLGHQDLLVVVVELVLMDVLEVLVHVDRGDQLGQLEHKQDHQDQQDQEGQVDKEDPLEHKVLVVEQAYRDQ